MTVERINNSIFNYRKELLNHSLYSKIKDIEDLRKEVKDFLEFTFNIIEEGKPHKVAAAFTFGRENLIPSMFTAILKNFQKNFPEQDISKLIYYFERHIELDEDEHGPMAIEMVKKLAENDPIKWKEIEEVSIEALKKRIELWNSIENIVTRKNVLI